MVIMMHFMKQKIGYLIMICQSIIIFSSTNEYNAFHETHHKLHICML